MEAVCSSETLVHLPENSYRTSYKLYCILRIVTVVKASFLKKYNLQRTLSVIVYGIRIMGV